MGLSHGLLVTSQAEHSPYISPMIYSLARLSVFSVSIRKLLKALDPLEKRIVFLEQECEAYKL